MAVTEANTFNTSVSTTELSIINGTSTIATSTTAGCYQCYLDLSVLDAGDRFEFRVYEKVRSASTQRVVMLATFQHAQGTDGANWVSPPLLLLNGWDMTLKRVAGTDRTIEASIRKAG